MMLDISEEMVRDHFSNVQMAVMGEQTLLERISPAMRQWEIWLIENMLPEDVMHLPEVEPLCIDVVVFGALRDSLPMLDVVLTPNGLATVGNSNLVPASSARSEAARRSLSDLLFRAQDCLLAVLRAIPHWRVSLYGVEFSQSLFVSLGELCRLDKERKDLSYESAMAMRQMACLAENRFARLYVSHPLLRHLREMNFADTPTEAELHVIRLLKEAVFSVLRSDGRVDDLLLDMVNFIKRRPEEFRIWHESDVAGIFADHSFKNDPDAGGFFFR